MAKVIKISKPKESQDVNKAIEKKPKMTALEAMERLSEVMNNTPRIVHLAGKDWELTALKPGTQWKIAEEAVKIAKAESSAFGDVIKEFAVNIPSVVRVLTLALLNDKDKINGAEYQTTYNTIMWESDTSEWMGILVDVLQMLSLDFFFDSTNAIAMMREMALGRKTTKAEQKSS